MKKISVIIPCYNSEKYMDKCLEAFTKQNFEDAEYIFVDDNSSDDTYKFLKEYEKTSKIDMHVIHNEVNIGPGASRGKALKQCKGQWIAFCDADDYYDYSFMDKMYKMTTNSDVDCVMCSYNKVFSDGKIEKVDYLDDEDVSKEYVLANVSPSLCVLLVRKRVFDDINFIGIRHGEDAAIIPSIIINSRKIKYVKEALYNYVMREDSASNLFDESAYYDTLKSFECMKDKLRNYPEVLEFVAVKQILYTSMINGIKAKVDKNILKRAICDFKKEFPKYRDNNYYKEWSLLKKIFVFCISNRLFVCAKIITKVHHIIINH